MRKLTFYLFVVILATGCNNHSHCNHNFVYTGRVNAGCLTLYPEVAIRFENLGDIIFKIPSKQYVDSSLLDGLGNYRLEGSFLTSCESDMDIFTPIDSLGYQLVYKNKVLQEGKISLQKTIKKYFEEDYKTEIQIPDIILKVTGSGKKITLNI